MLHEVKSMTKINKSDAFIAAVSAMEKGEYKVAQQILNYVSQVIREERDQRIITQYLFLKSQEEELLFQDVYKLAKTEEYIK